MKLVTLYTFHQAASYTLSFTFLALFSARLAYLHMSFILQLTCIGSAGQLENK